LNGYLLLGSLLNDQPEKFSGAYNFGPYPQDHLSVKQLVLSAINRWGNGNWKDVSYKDQPHEAGLLQLDITKAITELNWKPKFNAAKSIEWTINWYKQPREEQAQFTIQQIKEYIAL
jgi:CDP-glucose 4,6-dehydratase